MSANHGHQSHIVSAKCDNAIYIQENVTSKHAYDNVKNVSEQTTVFFIVFITWIYVCCVIVLIEMDQKPQRLYYSIVECARAN